MDGEWKRHRGLGWGVGVGQGQAERRMWMGVGWSSMGDGTRSVPVLGTATVAGPDASLYLDRTGPRQTAEGMAGTVMGAGRPRVLTAIGKAGRQNQTKKRRWPPAMVPPFDQAPPTVLGTGRCASRRAQACQVDTSRWVAGPVACSGGGNGESRGFRPR